MKALLQRLFPHRFAAFMGSANYSSEIKSDDGEVLQRHIFIVSFFAGEGSLRISTVSAPRSRRVRALMDFHGGLRCARHDWECFGKLPSHVERPLPPAQLVSIAGGKAGGIDA